MVPAEPSSGGLSLPAIGVEIVSAEERKGARYYTIRDLRNGNTVQNVTLASARKLWSYAINQYLTNQVDPVQVTWHGDYGLWQAARRAKKLRYDLALRQPDGSVRVFYGVTADGMTGPWAQFLRAEDKGNGEAEVETEDEEQVETEAWLEQEARAAAQPKPAAEAKPSRRPSRRKPKAEPKSEPEAKPEVEVKVETKPEVVVTAEARPAIEVKTETPARVEVGEPAEAKPKARSRRRKPQTETEPQGKVEAEVKPEPKAEVKAEVKVEPAAELRPQGEAKPKARARSRKPKATPEVEA